MNKKMIEILEDVRWWDTCPEDWKKEIFDFLASENEKSALNIPFVINWVACSEKLPERRKRVLVTDGRLVTEAHLNKRNNTWEGYMIVGVQELEEPIWWAELPAPPCL